MKKVILGLVVLGFLCGAFAKNAEVKTLRDNGKISGVQSTSVECTNGAMHVLYKKDGTWHHGVYGHIGDRFNSWSLDQLARYQCKEM